MELTKKEMTNFHPIPYMTQLFSKHILAVQRIAAKRGIWQQLFKLEMINAFCTISTLEINLKDFCEVGVGLPPTVTSGALIKVR